MNPAMTAENVGFGILRDPEEGILSFLASRSKRSARALSPSAADVFRGCSDAVRQLLCAAVEARNEEEFDHLFESEFPKYVGLVLAMSNFASAVVPKPLIERLTRESICEMEADFRDKGMAVFGTVIRDQALFTVWTLRKINELVTRINAVKPSEAKRKDDVECCANFNLNTLRAQFCLDCLITALDSGQAVYPEVLESLMDGLRAMVNAYAWARRGLEARIPTQEPNLSVTEVDEDDRQLMDASLAEASEFLSAEEA